MDCIECGKSSPYKCPRCRRPYCSVPCCKKHKLAQCTPPDYAPNADIQEQINTTYEFPTEDTVPPDKLKLLDNSAELKECLANPHVRKILEIIDKSPHPDELMQEYMQEPIFTEFVDSCLKVIQPQEDKAYEC